jgi:hypothetical protein
MNITKLQDLLFQLPSNANQVGNICTQKGKIC